MSGFGLRERLRQRLWGFNRRFRSSVTVATRQGRFALPTDVDDPISKALFVQGEYECDLIVAAMKVVREVRGLPRGKGTVLDVGANNGVISIGMLVTGELERAIAVEPEPRNFSILRHNVALNHLEQSILCLNRAASDRRTALAFELSGDNLGDHRVRTGTPGAGQELFAESGRRTTEVQGDTLDNLIAGVDQEFRRDIAVIWIDVQGYEGYAFAGAKTLLSTGVPVVSEIWPYGIRRAGMSRDTFCGIVEGTWSVFWAQQGGRFVQRRIDGFRAFYDGLGEGGAFENVIFARSG